MGLKTVIESWSVKLQMDIEIQSKKSKMEIENWIEYQNSTLK